MGEIILSIVIGGCLALSGVILIVTLDKEEKSLDKREEDKR